MRALKRKVSELFLRKKKIRKMAEIKDKLGFGGGAPNGEETFSETFL